MKRVLIVAYYFPPIGGIGSIRLARFAELLPEFGWEPLVLAPTETPHPADPTLHYPEERVVRSRSIEISRVGRLAGSAPSGDPTSSTRPSLRALGARVVAYPDPQIGWFPGAVRAGLRELKSESFDAIYSSSFPVTAHLVAKTLARRSGVPWLAEFRDPWSAGLPRIPHRRRALRLERRIAKRADAVAMPTPTWAAHFGRQWGTEVRILPNGFDAAIPHADAPAGRPVIAHLGTYYPGRQSLRPLWSRLRARADRDPSAAPVVRFIGELPSAARSELDEAGINELVEVTGLVGHDEALRLVASATALVAAGAVGRDPIARGWVPAKLFEYVASDRPVLYLGDPAGDASTMLQAVGGCHVIDPSDEVGVDRALTAALEGTRHVRAVDGMSRRARARDLASLLDSVSGHA